MSTDPELVDGDWRDHHLRLEDASISDLRVALANKHISSEELVEAYIARIEEVNDKVSAVSVINKEAIEIARQKDIEREGGKMKGLLHGIPILVKDIFLTLDQMPIGCSGLKNATPKFEADVIMKLREEGAVLLGKTVPSEWCNYRSPGNAPNGWSPVGGQCLGIYCDGQDPGGSSSGSGVAIALGLAAAALGAETSGSIASPARSSGIIGLKPTTGLIPRNGMYCVSEWQDSVGVLAKTVEDAAHLLTALAGNSKESMDNMSRNTVTYINGAQELDLPTDFRAACRSNGLEGLRLAIPRHIMNRDKYVMEEFDDALQVMRGLGATIVEDARYSEWSLSYWDDELWEVAPRIEILDGMSKFLSQFEHNPHELHSLEDVMEFTSKTQDEENVDWGMEEWEIAVRLNRDYGKGSEKYRQSYALRQRMADQIAELLERHQCDLIVAPSWTDTTANVGGCPQISVPLRAYPKGSPLKRLAKGLISNGPYIPTGLLIVGRRNDDARVIGAAHAFERATERPPGQPRDNLILVPKALPIFDIRHSEMVPSLDRCGFEWVKCQTTGSLEDEESITQHIRELESLVKDATGARMALTFDYQIRKRELDRESPQIRPVSTFVHIDITPSAAEDRIRFSFPEIADSILNQRYRILSVWHPLVSPILDYPLAVCDSRTLPEDDLIESDFIYPNFESETFMVFPNVAHKWYYMSEQCRDDVLLLVNFDSEKNIRVPHSGFELPPDMRVSRLRESFEMRVIVTMG
ncbi:amidase signature enzyme [Lophiostoma macrostomum CBS 122681]|uniref:Amidase signature enzyme n=1 Tax=Lophiostoma macrostomum CBS 122681 TaxID=1314788 RepID=A0A6A6T5S8_9PLEO|nr:amidase signature enzyme [Lophiostoma macrostomum CBS 122681]